MEHVLNVRQGELCWVVGTVYMEMTLKPNVLDDLAKEVCERWIHGDTYTNDLQHWIIAPPPREKYTSADGTDLIFLEDESGRLQLTGELLQSQLLVTGCIIAAMGSENASGEFEVLDVKVADLPAQPERSSQASKAGKIAIVSGLGIAGDGSDVVTLDLLSEYLLGESTEGGETAQISRLIMAGNNLSQASPIPTREEVAARPSAAAKKYGHDTSAYNAAPTEQLDAFIAQLLPSIPITLMPGASDPASVAIPQQPLHPALFPHSRTYSNTPNQPSEHPNWFDSVTNPWQGNIDGWRFLGNSGQPIDDIYKYVKGTNRLRMMEHLLRWRNNAPTAPDTLCISLVPLHRSSDTNRTLGSYPFQDNDPFILRECPHVYFVGNQPSFATSLIEGPAGQQVRLIAVPKFKETGTLVLLDAETLEAETVTFSLRQPKIANGH